MSDSDPAKSPASPVSQDETQAQEPGAPKDPRKGGAPAKKAASKNASAGRPQVVEWDEAELNAPSKSTLVMLGTLSVATLLMWGAGRAACNYHVPGESLTPRTVSLKDRTRGSKEAGFEFAHALSRGDFATARELAQGEGLAAVEKEQAACGACQDRVQASEHIHSVAALLKANTVDAIVEVRSVGPGGEQRRVLGVERIEREWRVTRTYSSVAEAQLKDAPAAVDAAPGADAAAPDEAAVPGETQGAALPPGHPPVAAPGTAAPAQPGTAAPARPGTAAPSPKASGAAPARTGAVPGTSSTTPGPAAPRAPGTATPGTAVPKSPQQ